jgi:hypothetical protein
MEKGPPIFTELMELHLACVASIDTSESWVCCREKHQPRILPEFIGRGCSRIGRGVTGCPCTGGQNHAYERRDLAPVGYGELVISMKVLEQHLSQPNGRKDVLCVKGF